MEPLLGLLPWLAIGQGSPTYPRDQWVPGTIVSRPRVHQIRVDLRVCATELIPEVSHRGESHNGYEEDEERVLDQRSTLLFGEKPHQPGVHFFSLAHPHQRRAVSEKRSWASRLIRLYVIRRWLTGSGDAQTYRLDGGLSAIADGQFLKYRCEMVLHRFLGDVETLGQLVGG
jgi:hypothetical protein